MSSPPIPVPQESYVVVRRRAWPVATLAILALNLAVFLLETFHGDPSRPDVVLDFGASFGPYIRRGEYWRLVMPIFLHGGWWHLALNGYAIYVLGPFLERLYGYGRFVLLYVACGIGSSLLSSRLSSNVSVGASGAIFGMAGVMLVAGYLHREAIPRHWMRVFGRGMLPFIVLNLALGYAIPRIDNWGHLGGLATGLVLALLVPPLAHDRVLGSEGERPSQAVVVLPIAVVALAMFATFANYRTSHEVTRILAEGEQFRRNNQPDRALERFQEAARRAPRDDRPHLELGALYLSQKKLDNAIQEYQEAARLSPGSPEPQVGLGMAYQLKGDAARAQQAFATALQQDPKSPDAQRLLADLCLNQKLYREAIQHYQEALLLDPNDALSHNNLAWLYATAEDARFHDPRAALEHARRAVELTHWKEAGFIDTLAEAQYASGQYAEAVHTQTRALELEPQNQELRDHMARYRQAAGV